MRSESRRQCLDSMLSLGTEHPSAAHRTSDTQPTAVPAGYRRKAVRKSMIGRSPQTIVSVFRFKSRRSIPEPPSVRVRTCSPRRTPPAAAGSRTEAHGWSDVIFIMCLWSFSSQQFSFVSSYWFSSPFPFPSSTSLSSSLSSSYPSRPLHLRITLSNHHALAVFRVFMSRASPPLSPRPSHWP